MLVHNKPKLVRKCPDEGFIDHVSYLFLCAVVHKHHVVFSRYFFKLFSLFPLIFSLVKEPVGGKQTIQLIQAQGQRKSIASSHFFLKISLALFRSAAHSDRLF